MFPAKLRRCTLTRFNLTHNFELEFAAMVSSWHADSFALLLAYSLAGRSVLRRGPVLGVHSKSREYGWAASHERLYDARPKGKKTWVSLIAAASLKGVMAEQALVITDTVNQNPFLCFLETTLLPTLPQRSVLVLDNWTVHHGQEVRALVERFGCELLYLPTYSPDFNPIEHLFAKIKAFVKHLRPDATDKLIQAFCDAVKTVSPQNVRNAFAHCGYHVEH